MIGLPYDLQLSLSLTAFALLLCARHTGQPRYPRLFNVVVFHLVPKMQSDKHLTPGEAWQLLHIKPTREAFYMAMSKLLLSPVTTGCPGRTPI